MRTLIFLLLSLLLAGCVTVAMPPNQPPPTTTTLRSAGTCPTYIPPRRRSIPSQPDVDASSGNYLKDLEALAEKLAIYAGSLRDYIDEEHADEDAALRRHQQECE